MNISYYGRLDFDKISNKKRVVYHMLEEYKIMLLNALKEMEERLKGHALECKRVMMHEIKKNSCKCNKPTKKEKIENEKNGIYPRPISLVK